MRIGDLPFKDLAHRLKSPGLTLRAGPFSIHIQSSLRQMCEAIALLYQDYPLATDADLADFHVRVAAPAGLRAWIRPQALFISDGEIPFKPMPLSHAFALFEWGLNWCIANNAHQYVIIHAAAVERGGRAVIFPGPPGTGKSTLCAALVNRNWRLLSDELALLSLDDRKIAAVPRPISLKNNSIDLIRNFAPSVVIGPALSDTAKGQVAHMRVPLESVRRANETAESAWVVLPKYEPNGAASLTSFSKARAFMDLAQNAFNYSLLGADGFTALSNVVDQCECYEFSYGNLMDAVETFDALVGAASIKAGWENSDARSQTEMASKPYRITHGHG